MTGLQILAFAMASVAAGAFFLAACLLAPEATGWHGAPWGVRAALYALAALAAMAAVYVREHPEITGFWPMLIDIIFACAAIVILIIVMRRRSPRPERRSDPHALGRTS